MLMTRVLCVLLAVALLCGALTGRISEVSQASISGAKDAVTLLIAIGGTICLWSGLMEVMRESGLANKVARALRPVITLLFGKYAKDEEAREALSQNMAANLLGLGSAATPAGLRAAKRLNELADRYGEPPDAACLLIVVNTASLQLLPTTIAAVRAACGSAEPYDILPSVWLASAGSVLAAVVAAKLLQKARHRP
ncbi:MAG: nucleoside recognition domain-containing protein [Clostridiaceae bacterium]|nr:nucleoside recognition domain-containing protein [Clostridiaceae bacterium]